MDYRFKTTMGGELSISSTYAIPEVGGKVTKCLPGVFCCRGTFSFCLTTLDGRPLRVVIALVLLGELSLLRALCGT